MRTSGNKVGNKNSKVWQEWEPNANTGKNNSKVPQEWEQSGNKIFVCGRRIGTKWEQEPQSMARMGKMGTINFVFPVCSDFRPTMEFFFPLCCHFMPILAPVTVVPGDGFFNNRYVPRGYMRLAVVHGCPATLCSICSQ